jgi:alanyl-tRNA synthetase
MTSNEIRSSFLKFFEERGHRIVPSSPLVPGDDPTLLFTNAGMNQFKDALLGREKRDYTRATTAQKIMRVSGKHNDLDNVGPSHRHHTFFEMLGNFSFGDYSREEALPFAWELLTGVWKMPKDKFVVSIFKGEHGIPRDDKAYEIWRKLGIPADRILELGEDDNFWSMGDTGPCGRCSEIYFVRGGSGVDPEIELWNNVFMEFERSEGGTLTPLPAPAIDTGMGLERIAAVLQNKTSNYDTDLFQPLLRAVGDLAGVKYGASDASDVSLRVVADHIRSTTFLIGDGVIPSNDWRGYVLRKIMRRAMRHGKHLGLTEPFMHKLVAVIDAEMGDAYPGVRTGRAMIEKTILAEEHRFEAVLTEGLPRLEAELEKISGTKSKVLPGDVAFKLYDTFGVPFDFIVDTAEAQGVKVDEDAYKRAMEGQRDKARAKSGFKGGGKEAAFVWQERQDGRDGQDGGELRDSFEGYSTTSVTSVPIVALWNEDRQPAQELSAGQSGYVALAKTPFYLEAGGQVSDSGRITNAAGAVATVEGLAKTGSGTPRAHVVRVSSGTLKTRDIVSAEVDADVRNATRRNHTATHLLHAALRQVLGTHVAQKGSLVAPDRLRFDFSHPEAVTRDELDRIERIVNEQIYRNTSVTTDVDVAPEKAIASGAMALFGEKYGDKVRVVSIPGFSVELCGGTHVGATGDIGFFVILAESGVAAGVRRIEAVTGAGAVEWAQQQRASLDAVVGVLKVNHDQAVEAIERLQAESKKLAREVTQLKTKLATGGGGSGDADDTIDVSGVKLIRRKVQDLDKDALRGVADSLKAKIKSGVVILACSSTTGDGKVQVVVAVTPDLTSKIKAGQVVKEIAPIVGGGGGGRPDFAEAGGKQPEKIDEMLDASVGVIKKVLGA